MVTYKKIILPLLISSLILFSSVYAILVPYLDDNLFAQDGVAKSQIVIGEDSPTIDSDLSSAELIRYEIAGVFSEGGITPDPEIIIGEDLADKNMNLILIGGPSSNRLTAALVTAEKSKVDWDTSSGDIEVVYDAFTDGKVAIIVGGASASATEEAADALSASIPSEEVGAPKGVIAVWSSPAGTNVYLDGILKGKSVHKTWFYIYDVSVGYHSLKLIKKGYEDYSTISVNVEAGQTARVTAKLVPIATTPPTQPPPTTSPPATLPSQDFKITSPSDIKNTVNKRISDTQNLAESLYALIQTGKKIGADVSGAEKKFNTAVALLQEANQSYNKALEKLGTDDIVNAVSQGNEAYTKGTSGMEMLEETKPLIYSAIKQRLDSGLAGAESLAGMSGGLVDSREKIQRTREEIAAFSTTFSDEQNYKTAAEHAQNAHELISGLKRSIYMLLGSGLLGVGLLGFVITKTVPKLRRRPGERKVKSSPFFYRLLSSIFLIRQGERKSDVKTSTAAVQKSHANEPSYDTSTKAITVKNLTKRYKNTTILENVSFEIEQGKLMAIVGSSGSGKSTLIEAVAGRLTPDGGEIRILGMDSGKERMKINRFIGFVPQHPELYLEQKVWQNMMNSAIKWEIKDTETKTKEILKQLGIYERRNIPAKSLSGGQLKRLSLGMELIREPAILVLDEPTTGLDPTSRDQIITALSKMVFNQGKTCTFTTHFMDEAEHCDDVIIVGDKGIVAKGSPLELAKRMPGMGRIVEITLEVVKEEIVDKLKEKRGIHTIIREGRILKIVMDSPDAIEVSQEIKNFGGIIEGAKVTKAGMKEVFVHYTGVLPEESQ